MKKPLIVANWKMNKNVAESVLMVKKLKKSLNRIMDKEFVICPAFTSIYEVSKLLKGSNIMLGAQNMHFENSGPFTGEISPLMLKELSCKYVLLGHSERRHIFFENNEFVNRKVLSAIEYGLFPILCIGEKLQEREKGNTKEFLLGQLKECLKNISAKDISNVVIAYEPVWAIGTGVNATPEQAEEAHLLIRTFLKGKFNYSKTRILYGGSVNPDNIRILISQKNVDGVLVGGASLNAKGFIKIAKDSF